MGLRTAIDKLTLIGIHNRDDIDLVRRVRTGNLMSFAGILILLPMGIIAYTEGHTLLALLDFVCATVLTLNLILFAVKKNFHLFSLTAVTFITGFFFYLFVTGGSRNTGHLWSYTLPIVSMFLIGSRRGGIFTLVYLTASVVTIALRPSFLPGAATSPEFVIRYVLSFGLTGIFIFTLENYRRRASQDREETIHHLRTAERVLYETNEELRKEIESREKAERELLEAKNTADTANEFKSEFLANMSHELRTPLNHIIGFTDILRQRQLGELNEKQCEFLGDIAHSGQHLLSLINDILDLSKIEAGKTELNLSVIDFHNIIDAGMRMIREKATEHEIALFAMPMEGVRHFVADERKIRQVFYNLLSNAVKFTPDGGTVTVKSVVDATGTVEVSVTDTGIGIDADKILRVFDSFEQLENSGERKYEGTGLGLSLSRKLVELHGGRIEARSDGAGKGSTFSFSIPPHTIPEMDAII